MNGGALKSESTRVESSNEESGESMRVASAFVWLVMVFWSLAGQIFVVKKA